MKARATTAKIEVDGFEIELASQFFATKAEIISG
jgi:hypothetical protein